MKIARDAPTFFILGTQQPSGKATKFVVQQFELLRVAMQLGEYADLRAQQFRHYWDRQIVDRTALVAFQAVHIGKMYGGDKNNRGLLKTWMLPDNLSKFKS